MFELILKKVLGSRNERELKRMQPFVQEVNGLEERISALSDEDLKGQTDRFREQLEQGASLDDIAAEAFATVRETGKRTMAMRHYDVQLIGGYALHNGMIAEMKTGEGKTLAATLPMYLNALDGNGTHLVTVNDYLAQRDAEWMGTIYRFLGLSTGVVYGDMGDEEKRVAYRSDITYGQNNEFGFDFLRDNMKFTRERFAQRELNYAIVDEVDSILIDEARTPLIISGRAEKSSDLYYKVNDLIRSLKRDQDFIVDEKAYTCTLTEVGVDRLERKLDLENLYSPENGELLHHLHQALRAHNLYKRDGNYLVEEGKVVIVDDFTGRKMPGRRWSDGLHQAVEAKEGLKIQDENTTLATITFQNYFRMYNKLAGMTGTADTEAEEFANIYDLDVLVIPTNMPVIRDDRDDVVYVKERAKAGAIIDDIEDCATRNQPVLVGTTSVDKSEFISRLLIKKGIEHNVLNAKYHEQEAKIVMQAGKLGNVTIATNMAGRGTDIVLGGRSEYFAEDEVGLDAPEDVFKAAFERSEAEAPERRRKVLEAGGLHIIGTERHESRRIDNQLRGRSGRQGDPGSSKFYLSLEDDLLRIFGAERIQAMLERFNVPEDEPIEHKWVTKAIANAQRKVEARNFDIRKSLLDYDDVMNQQRDAIYKRRLEVIDSENLHDFIREATEQVAGELVHSYYVESQMDDEWDISGLEKSIKNTFKQDVKLEGVEPEVDALNDAISEQLFDIYKSKEDQIVSNMKTSARYEAQERHALQQAQAEAEGNELGAMTIDEEKLHEAKIGEWRNYEQGRYLQIVDTVWKDHLQALKFLKEGVNLYAYAQKDPKLIYKEEAFQLFRELFTHIWQRTVEAVYQQEVQSEEEIQRHIRDRKEGLEKKLTQMRSTHVSMTDNTGQSTGSGGGEGPVTFRREEPKVGRNDPCPCGSGKKYKKCCLAKEGMQASA